MRLCPKSTEFTRLVTIWGIYECLVLSMGTSPAADVFQGRVSNRLIDIKPRPPKTYIDDILAAREYNFEYHITYLHDIFTRLIEAGLQVNLVKSALCQKALEYVGFWVTTQGYKPLESRIQGILDMQPLKSKKDVRTFIGMINFIKNHIPKRAAILEPLTRLTKEMEKFQWKEEQKIAFETIKAKCAESMMLIYPHMDKVFDLYPDSCDIQIGCFLLQEGYALGCFSKKMNEAQLKYPMTDKELLACHEGLKYFSPIIRGGCIRVFCDHKNLTFGHGTVHTSQRVLRQKCEISQDFNAEILHINGEDNPGGDGMSRLPTKASTIQEKEIFLKQKIYTFDEIFPLDLNYIKKEQENDGNLIKLKSNPKEKDNIDEDIVCGVKITTYLDKVYVPRKCRDDLVN